MIWYLIDNICKNINFIGLMNGTSIICENMKEELYFVVSHINFVIL